MNTTTTEAATGAIAFCDLVQLPAEDAAPIWKALLGRLMADDELRAIAKANSREDFYTALPMLWQHIDQALLGAESDLATFWQQVSSRLADQVAA